MSSALSIGTQTVGLSSILKEGLKSYKGIDSATLKNVAAVLELGDLVRTSFGPCGRNKLIPSVITNAVYVTSDAKTILNESGVFHPAAKLLAEAAMRHGAEHGDGSTLLVILCSALLSKAGELVQQGVRPSYIIEGYDVAVKQCLQLLESLIIDRICPQWKTSSASDLATQLKPLMLTAIGSKQGGDVVTADLLASLASQAMAIAVPFDHPERFELDNVRIVRILGSNVQSSHVMRGLVLNRIPETLIKQFTDPVKVAVFSCELDLAKTETKGTVLITNAEQMKRLGQDEEAELISQFTAIADTGARLLITQDRIGDLALHVLDRLGLCALRVPSKFDVRRICRATGAQCMTSLTPAPTSDSLGTLNNVTVQEIGADIVTILDAPGAISSIILRGSSQSVLEDHERSILGGLSVCRSLLVGMEDSTTTSNTSSSLIGALVPGAGASEVELCKRMREWANEVATTTHNADTKATGKLPLLAIKSFPEALMAIPEALADNAGHDALDVLSKLESAHLQGRLTAGVSVSYSNDDIVEDTGVRDLYKVKREAIKMAVKICNLILSVEQIFMSKQVTGAPSARRPASTSLDAD